MLKFPCPLCTFHLLIGSRLLQNTTPTANIIPGITESLLLRAASSKNVHCHPERVLRGKRRNKMLGKEEVRLTLFADDMIVHTIFYRYLQIGRINKRV